jgi:hypothetical protein
MVSSPDNKRLQRSQIALARRFGVEPCDVSWNEKVGVSGNLRDRQLWPVNGLRHPPHMDTAGWYFWAGEELSQDPDFFVPLHAQHLQEWRPEVLPYLLLPPGWRFLIAPGYEDVWEDPALRDVR